MPAESAGWDGMVVSLPLKRPEKVKNGEPNRFEKGVENHVEKQKKEQVVQELRERFQAAQAVYVTHYRGLTVKQSNELRRSMDKAGAKYHVSKNTLVQLVVAGTDFELLTPELKGPTGLVFVQGDPAAAAKALCEMAKKHEPLKIQGGVLGGKFLTAADIEALSKLPSRDQMLAMFVGVVQGPLRNLVGVLSGVPRSFVQVLHAIEQKKAA
jgi:large subunit ribosomal protein L10